MLVLGYSVDFTARFRDQVLFLHIHTSGGILWFWANLSHMREKICFERARQGVEDGQGEYPLVCPLRLLLCSKNGISTSHRQDLLIFFLY